MRRRYDDGQREDGNCAVCSLVHDEKDCRERQISPLSWARMASGIDQPTLAEKSGVDLRIIQKVEGGEVDAGSLTERNLLALASVLDVDPVTLI